MALARRRPMLRAAENSSVGRSSVWTGAPAQKRRRSASERMSVEVSRVKGWS